MSDLRQQKKDLRLAMQARRAEFCRRVPDAPLKLRDIFLRTIKLAPKAVVSGYCARPGEMDPLPLMNALHAAGHPLALPVTPGKGQPLIFRTYKPGDRLVPGALAIPEPSPAAAAVEPDVLLVPLLAFDPAGNRLGYGAGYYDRTLTALRRSKPILAVGIAYSCQEVTQVPAGPGDALLDKIVTEIKEFQP